MLPRGYPYVPARAKLAVFPYVCLAVVGLVALDDAGLVDLQATQVAHRGRSDIQVPTGLSFTSAHGCRPAADWRNARLDSRVRELLTAAARHRIRVSCLRTGHTRHVRGTRRVSNHTVWRAVDIDQIAGRPVGLGNPAAKRLALAIGRGQLGVRPSEVGSPWSFGRRPWFTDSHHQHHLHIGFIASADIPPRYLALYQQAGADERVPWQVLAAIGKVESDHGRARLPGVRSGANWAGACGPMQIGCVLGSKAGNSWARYGRGSPYPPENAIPAAARYLVGYGAHGNLDRAIYGYNHDWDYVALVKSWARRYQSGRS